jgi:hypothetical protein
MPQIFKGTGVSEHIRSDEVQRFAIMHRLKTKLDEDTTRIIPGKHGHIYEHGNGLLGVVVMPNPPRKHYWGFTRSLLLGLNFRVIQSGDGEGAATFDPNDHEQAAAAAIRSAGVKCKRRISPEQREKQIAQLRAAAGVAL